MPNTFLVIMTNPEYGNHHFREFETHRDLKVEHGQTKPARVRQKKGVVGIAAPDGGIAGIGNAGSNANRKDKWIRIAPDGKVTHPLVSGADPQHAMSMEEVQNLNDLYTQGDISYEDYEQAFDSYAERYEDRDSNSVIIST